MSEEESQPAPLRLKPRARPASEPAASEKPAPPAPAPIPEKPAEPAEPAEPVDELPSLRPRLRSKPRLSAEEEVPAEASPEKAPVVGDAVEPLPPILEPSPVAHLSPESPEQKLAPSFKLRLQTPGAGGESSPLPSAPPADTPPAPLPAVDSDTEDSVRNAPAPPMPVAAPALPDTDQSMPVDDSPLQPPDHLVPHLRATQSITEIENQVRAGARKPYRRKSNPLKGPLIFLVVLVVVSVAFWFLGRGLYQRFFLKEKTSQPTMAEVRTIPAKPVETIQPVVTVQRPVEPTAGQNPPANASGTKPQESTETPDSGGQVKADDPGQVEVEPPFPPPAKVEPAPPPPRPSAEFFSAIDRAVIGGVFQGTPAKALINGRTIRAGETLNEGLGIIFVGLDETRHKLIFRDGTGAEVIRKF